MREKIYKLLKQVPKGKVTTYKELAQAAGTRAYRAVGTYMKENPYAPEVPCHRVVKSDGSIGGFNGKTSGKDVLRKIDMLKKEGIVFEEKKIKDFKKYLHKF